MNIAICDDEIIYQNYIHMLCNEFLTTRNTMCNIFRFTSGEELLAFDGDIDLLLLDIEMSELNGIDVKEILIESKKDIKIIYISSHTELMQDAFGKNVYSFIAKPIIKDKLFKLLKKVFNDFEEDFIIETDNKAAPFIKGSSLVFIKAEDKYTRLQTQNNTYLVRKNMNEWEQILKGHHFYRIHRSYIVNLAFVKNINKEIQLQNDISVRISRNNIKEFQEVYYNYIKQRM